MVTAQIVGVSKLSQLGRDILKKKKKKHNKRGTRGGTAGGGAEAASFLPTNT